MLGNCEENMVIIPSTTNEWPQNQRDANVLIESSVGTIMEKQIQDQVQVQPAFKCPRCDSSNTKFCYYNNYSLSQPRHFCKACKRYWTRGGTLRNVPVGGGCRKNKRVKRASSVGQEISSASSGQVVNPSLQSSQVDVSLSSTRTHINNPLLYGLLTPIPSELNLPYSIRDGYDLSLPQLNTAARPGFSARPITPQNLGFSDVGMSVATSNPLLSSYNPMFGTSASSTSTMASIIASSLHQQNLVSSGFKDVAQAPYGFLGFDDVQMSRNVDGCLLAKDVKMEGHSNRFDWKTATNQNYIEEINSSDPCFTWNSSADGVWPDSSNIGPSVPSLI